MSDIQDNDFLRRFAKNSNVSLDALDTTLGKEQSPDDKIIIDLDDHFNTQNGESGNGSNEPLVRPGYGKRTKTPLYKNPWIRATASLIISIISLVLLAALFGANFRMQNAKDKPQDDQIAQKEESDLPSVQQQALPSTPAPVPTPQVAPPAKAETVKGKSSKPPKNLVTRSPLRRGTSTATTPVVLRRRSIPQDYGLSRRSISPYAWPMKGTPQPKPQPIAKPTQAQLKPEDEKTAQERMLAALAASGYSNQGNSQATGQPSQQQSQQPSQQQSQQPSVQEVSYLASEQAIIDEIPQEALKRSTKATGQLLSAIAFTPDNPEFIDGQPVEVEITDPVNSGLPAGTRIVAAIRLPKQSSAGSKTSSELQLVPTSIVKCDMEHRIGKSAISLTGKNGKPLIAKRGGSELLRGLKDVAQSLAGGIGAAGGSIINLPSGSGTGIVSAIPQALFGQQSQRSAKIEVLHLKELTDIQVNIRKPVSIPADSCGVISQEAQPIDPVAIDTSVQEQVPEPVEQITELENSEVENSAQFPTQAEQVAYSDPEQEMYFQNTQPDPAEAVALENNAENVSGVQVQNVQE
jgi:hypothetical protein